MHKNWSKDLLGLLFLSLLPVPGETSAATSACAKKKFFNVDPGIHAMHSPSQGWQPKLSCSLS